MTHRQILALVSKMNSAKTDAQRGICIASLIADHEISDIQKAEAIIKTSMEEFFTFNKTTTAAEIFLEYMAQGIILSDEEADKKAAAIQNHAYMRHFNAIVANRLNPSQTCEKK